MKTKEFIRFYKGLTTARDLRDFETFIDAYISLTDIQSAAVIDVYRRKKLIKVRRAADGVKYIYYGLNNQYSLPLDVYKKIKEEALLYEKKKIKKIDP